MKIIAIRGKNLASLEGEFEIDFSKNPLCSAGIFAITGSTGSGKSTLLDAMCIALFNNSPRINNVSDNVYIDDVKEDKIKEKDPRNILRKGCTDCFAQVEFRALDGKAYRATWSTRRARDNKNGRLQDWEYSLFNISDGKDIQGNKTDLLAKVQELLGLTYVQFTRAVLLAQGEFATFLKATSKEKAEILEKLTGTEIYSKISKRIFERNKEANNELQIIKEKIKEINILSPDESAELNTRKERLSIDSLNCEEKIKIAIEKQQWFEQEKRLKIEFERAEKEHQQYCDKFNCLSPTVTLLQQIDTIQEIRDDYSKILICKSDREANDKLLKSHEQQVIAENNLLKKYELEVKEAVESRDNANRIFKEKQPKLNEGLRIETATNEKRKSLAECSNETAALKELYNKEKKEEQALTKEIEEKNEILKGIQEWFAANNEYEKIVPHCEIIVTNIIEISDIATQIKTKSKLLVTAEKEVAAKETLLVEERESLERLKSTLTTEIAILRARLVDGEPCPVCGSLHHPVESVTENTISEKELENAEKALKERIEFIVKILDNYRIEVAQLKASIDNYRSMHEERCKATLEKLKEFPAADKKVAERDFAILLKGIADEWKNKENISAATRERLSVAQNSLVNKKAICKELENRIQEKEKEEKLLKEIIEENSILLKGILGAFSSIEEKRLSLHNSIEKANEQFVQVSEKRNAQLGKCKEINGAINSCKERKLALEILFEELKERIQNFLESRKDNMTLEILHKLATIPTDEIQEKRKAVENASVNVAKASATVKERKRTLDEHRRALNKPLEKETIEDITELIASLKEENRVRSESITQLTVELKRNEENSVLYKKYEKEHCAKLEKSDNWQKLQELFGSSDGTKFKVMAQGYTLDILLGYANKHLADISQRYELARISPASLSIKVIDKDMLSESRSVHSLSGGESFIVSLALALALSSLSSNRMNIESLFIDEGFGSLDSETLRVAMEALEKLQGQGRKIGVISHLSEMIERIPVQIRIIKCSSGKSKVEIKG
ncbi:MAG: AAA family ATPase [Bacteroidaceae bacterium]|nr:AAA family ATPase [Bacteroidaceae bacterium]